MKAIEKEYAANHVKFQIATDDSVYTRASADGVVIDLYPRHSDSIHLFVLSSYTTSEVPRLSW
jgi:hypothetical protein